jgi:serine O-acetyltransferase
MNLNINDIKLILGFFRCFPHIITFYLSKNKSFIIADINRWQQIYKKKFNLPVSLIYLLSTYREFRNLFYHRIGEISYLLNVFCPKDSTLQIRTKEIGEGFFIAHGCSTNIGAKSIGKNCWVSQQVTIGFHKGFPTILDNVVVHPGAIILGDVTIGHNSVIGANATVYKNVPDNCTVFPAHSLIMKWSSQNADNNSINKNPI